MKEVLDAACRTHFSVFFQRAWREVESGEYSHNWHIDYVSELLELAYEGEKRRLIINVPPRTLKTLMVNIMFPAWLLGKNPGCKIISLSYSQRLSEKISYKCKKLLESDWYKELFPETILDPNYSQRINFLTTANGGRYTTSVGGALIGEGADFIIIDDPIDPKKSLSDVERVNTNEWMDSSIYTRLDNQNTGVIIMIMQRLHSDDPTGHLMAKGGWELVKIPAYTKERREYTAKGFYAYEGYLHEARLGKQVLEDLERELTPIQFAGQYLQEPVPLGGNDFNREMFNFFSVNRFDVRLCNLYILVDPATSKSDRADYTAMVVMALAPDNNIYVVDGVRKRLKGIEKTNALFDLHRKWSQASGRSVVVGYEQTGLSEDIDYIKRHQEEINYRFSIEPIKPKTRMDKETKIRRLVPFMERKQIWFPLDLFHKNEKGLSENLINVIIEQEFLLFPNGLHDDFIDAMAMLFDLRYYFPKMGEMQVINQHVRPANNSVWDII